MRVPIKPGAREYSLQPAAREKWGQQTRKEKLKWDFKTRGILKLTCPFLSPSLLLPTSRSNRCRKLSWAVIPALPYRVWRRVCSLKAAYWESASSG